MDFRYFFSFFLFPFCNTKKGDRNFFLFFSFFIISCRYPVKTKTFSPFAVFAWPFCTCSLACSVDCGHYGLFWGWHCEGVGVRQGHGTRLSEKVSRQFTTVYVFVESVTVYVFSLYSLLNSTVFWNSLADYWFMVNYTCNLMKQIVVKLVILTV